MRAAVWPDNGPQPYCPLISGSAGFGRVFRIRIVDDLRWFNALAHTKDSAAVTTAASRTIAWTCTGTETTATSCTHAGAYTCSVGRSHERGQGISNTIALLKLQIRRNNG